MPGLTLLPIERNSIKLARKHRMLGLLRRFVGVMELSLALFFRTHCFNENWKNRESSNAGNGRKKISVYGAS